MVIVGYQGIGKSTLCKKNLKYVDLESSNFFVDGKRAEDWYIPYCSIAENLSSQGYDVFVSSHEVVRRELRERYPDLEKMIICPTVELAEPWTEKLKRRYEKTKHLDGVGIKNYKAYMNAKDRYVENITELMSESGFIIHLITDMEYLLQEEIGLKGIQLVELPTDGYIYHFEDAGDPDQTWVCRKPLHYVNNVGYYCGWGLTPICFAFEGLGKTVFVLESQARDALNRKYTKAGVTE